jgi:hypothetical protein
MSCNPKVETTNDIICTCCKTNHAIVSCDHGSYCEGDVCITVCPEAWLFMLEEEYNRNPD